jgi:hypothetical protein
MNILKFLSSIFGQCMLTRDFFGALQRRDFFLLLRREKCSSYYKVRYNKFDFFRK